MAVDREAIRLVALDIIHARGGIYANELSDAAGCSTQISAAVLKELCKDGLIERHGKRRSDRRSHNVVFRYYPVNEEREAQDMGAALFDLCDPKSNPNFSMGVEMDVERIDLETDLLSLRERLTLDLEEEGYCYGVKYALDRQDWPSVQLHLEHFEAHLKEKYDRVHKLLVRVRRQNRRK